MQVTVRPPSDPVYLYPALHVYVNFSAFAYPMFVSGVSVFVPASGASHPAANIALCMYACAYVCVCANVCVCVCVCVCVRLCVCVSVLLCL